MPDVDDIRDAIAESATENIQSVVVNGRSVTAKSIDEQIKAAQFLAQQQAKSRVHAGVRFAKLVPPGAG